ncbi:Rv3235 family protein [Streptomyces sp. NBC_01275]|uniref:Rv3235 family protein n=1 Tax=Streptomyces sp. NBC_01275 TaxID=2903807 RepID=UPI0022540517|nr:Rv3235 family protein [Streptomyces sp. NBC_01275]MCX4762563.1 Rv3235 family protein [Streptomyces sp. NBC_01275]
MNKVMTRAQHHPGTRPPGRRDTRRPAGAPPRTPGGGTPRTAPDGGRPPGSPGSAGPAHTRPADSRPAGAPPRTHTSRTTPTAPQPATTAPSTPVAPVAQPRPTDLFADRLLAVLSGRRPVHFMLRHTVGPAYDDLARLAERGPLRTRDGISPIVRDIGYYVPRPGAIEAFARIGSGDRLRAMAFRLELGADRRWRCTAVELGGPRSPRPRD